MDFERQAADEAAKAAENVEDVEDAQEGAIPDDEAQAVAGGRSTYVYLRNEGYPEKYIRAALACWKSQKDQP